MKKDIVLLVLLLVIIGNVKANDSKQIGGKQDVNLFSYGIRVEFSEANFMNLFKNFPLYIENSDEIKLMYYRRVGVLKNRRAIKSYVKKSFPPYVPSWGHAGNSGGSTKTGVFSTIRFSIEHDPFQKPEKHIIDKLINEYLHIGDEVWEVVFKLWGKEYYYYMFVDSKTHQIIRYCNMFGVSIPQSHIDYINRKCRQ